MRKINKKLVTDEANKPVAVIIDYEDWKEIERERAGAETSAPISDEEFLRRALVVKGTWKEGDGLEWQRRIRAEWERE